mgnify:CR=1 FL=1
MFQTLVQAFKSKDLRKKLLLTLAILFIYRIGCWLPIPGLDIEAFNSSVGNSDFLGLLSSVTGGALSNGSLLALGVVPYISASIIIQLLTVAIPALERLSKSGEEGRRKITFYTRITALVFALIQSIAIVLTFSANGSINSSALSSAVPGWIVSMIIVLVLVAGAMFTLWLGEKITDLGIGNGVSLLVFVGIVCSGGNAILNAFQDISATKLDGLWTVLIFAVMLFIVFALIVFVDLAERKIPVNYAKQIKGRKMYGGQSTYIPIKVNGSGVLPIIFATAIVAFPQLIMQLVGVTDGNAFYDWWAKWLGTGTVVYFLFNAVFIFAFTYFYAQLTFNPEDVSRTLQQNGGFIPGIRAGKPTMDYLKKISRRITFFGACYLTLIFIVPTVALSLVPKGTIVSGSLVNAFTVTGLLIVVSVALEFDKQLNAQLLAKNYRGFLK